MARMNSWLLTLQKFMTLMTTRQVQSTQPDPQKLRMISGPQGCKTLHPQNPKNLKKNGLRSLWIQAHWTCSQRRLICVPLDIFQLVWVSLHKLNYLEKPCATSSSPWYVSTDIKSLLNILMVFSCSAIWMTKRMTPLDSEL